MDIRPSSTLSCPHIPLRVAKVHTWSEHPAWCSKADHLSLQSTWQHWLHALNMILLPCKLSSIFLHHFIYFSYLIYWSTGSEAALREAEEPPLGKPACPLLAPVICPLPWQRCYQLPQQWALTWGTTIPTEIQVYSISASGMLLLKAG